MGQDQSAQKAPQPPRNNVKPPARAPQLSQSTIQAPNRLVQRPAPAIDGHSNRPPSKTVHIIAEQPPSNGAPAAKPSSGVGTILTGLFLLFVPIVALDAILIAIVYAFRITVPPSNALSNNSTNPTALPTEEFEPYVFYVPVSATTLALIASYSSTVASTFIAYFLTLLSFRVAHSIISKPLHDDLQGLPTPYELGLLINMIQGGTSQVWTWFKYYVLRIGRARPTTGNVLQITAFGVIMSVILTLLITAGDTWFHVATTTIAFPRLTQNDPPLYSFGRGFSEECLATYECCSSAGSRAIFGFDENATVPCSQLNVGDYVESFRTVSNVSSLNQLITVVSNGSTYVLLGDTSASSSIDYMAQTLAISAQCTDITQKCNLTTPRGTAQYDCSPKFNAQLNSVTILNGVGPAIPVYYWNMGFFNDSGMTKEAIIEYPVNPLYVGIAAFMSIVPQDVTDVFPLYGMHGVVDFILLCNATVYDATYVWINGSVANITQLTLSNVTSAGTLNGLLQANPSNISYGYAELTSGAALAGFTLNDTTDVANSMALTYSLTAMGFAASVFSPRLNLLEQSRDVLSVSRIPYAPFFALIGVNAFYALVSLIAAVVALVSSTTDGVAAVKSRFGIWGLVANTFGGDSDNGQDPESVLKNRDSTTNEVIGAAKTASGGWKFRVWQGV